MTTRRFYQRLNILVRIPQQLNSPTISLASMQSDRDAVAGFYIDIPALIAIFIGLSLFTFSIYSVHSSYMERRDSEDMTDRLELFVRDLRSNGQLTSSTGVFNGDIISTMDDARFRELYHPDTLGFDYRVEFQDNSGYTESYSTVFETADIPSHQGVYVRISSVLIREAMGINRLTMLRVTIWRVN